MSVGDFERGTPDRVTMPLLTRITHQSIDEDYQHVADRRMQLAESSRSGRLSKSSAVIVAVFGVIIATAAVQTSRNASEVATSRAGLMSAVSDRNDQVAALETQLRNLREQNTALQSTLEQANSEALAAEAQAEELAMYTGFWGATGPGVKVFVDDAPNGADDGRIRDEDLAVLVDGLWNAGAEAISINGQRLTALAPIRSSGITIHVNNEPVSPPYVLQAIGDISNLQSRFAESTHGLSWIALVDSFKFEYDMQNVDELELPGAARPFLRTAQLADPDVTAQRKEVEP
jgi:uncharacterized protein YlxW (UPF0749 family)